MSGIDFGGDNTARYYRIDDNADLTLPDGDWCIGLRVKFDSAAGTAFQYILSTNNFGASNSINIFLVEASVSAPEANGLKVEVRNSSGTIADQYSGSVADITSGEWLVIAQRVSGSLQFKGCLVGGSVQTWNTSATTASISGSSNGGNWFYGARADLSTARFFEEHAGQLFFIKGETLSDTQIADLANGDDLDDVGVTSANIEFNFTPNAPDATVSDDAGNGYVLTRYGSSWPSASTYDLNPEDFTPTDTTAPTLTSAAGTATIEGATGSVSTDEGNGTLYAVVTTSATAPSVAQIQAGQDHTGTAAAFAVGGGSGQTVSGTGTQNVSATGLDADTEYYWHFQHQDAAANDSTVVTSSSFATPPSFALTENATWTWYNNPRAVHYNGSTYIGFIDSAGDVTVGKYVHATGAFTKTILNNTVDVDDHNNPSLVVTPAGKIAAFYADNGSGVVRYRITTNAEDISAWDAEQTISGIASQLAYANIAYLPTAARYVLVTREYASSGRILTYLTSTDLATWSSDQQILGGTTTASFPYYIPRLDGDRLHFLLTETHPVHGNTKIGHMYAEWNSGAGELKFYTSAGVEITASKPFAFSDVTQVIDETPNETWNWSITTDASGNPRVLYSEFPSTTDHRLMFSRWDGSAWTTPVQVCTMGTYLYAAEPYYSAGADFHDSLPDTIFVGRESSGNYTVERWTSADNGATWAQAEILSPASATKKARPISPQNAATELVALWWEGTYTSFTSYDTDMFGSSGDVANAPVITLSNLTFSARTATSITPRLDVTVS